MPPKKHGCHEDERVFTSVFGQVYDVSMSESGDLTPSFGTPQAGATHSLGRSGEKNRCEEEASVIL